ncbi:MAG: cobalamin-binding protein [Anaerolineales bacterium]
MNIFRRPIAFAAWFAVFLYGCASAANSQPSATLTITLTPTPIATRAAPPTATVTTAVIRLIDGTGTEVDLPAPADRIVSLGPSNTEILFALGARDQIAGCDLTSDYPAEAKPLAVIADYPTLNVESIVALQPDLILAAEIISLEQVQSMRSLGLKVFYLANPTSLPDDLFANIRAIGTLTGKSPEGETVITGLQSRFDAVKQKSAKATSTPVVYFELDATDPARPYIAGPGSFVDTLIHLAGGRNLGAGLSSSWATISAEEILRQDPDIILLGDTGYGVTVESVALRPGWKNLNAVKNNAVYGIDSNLVLRPGPRLADGLEIIARRTHPEIFGTG